MVINKYGKENTILLHTPTYAEHETADAFREQVSNYLDVPIMIEEDGRSLWQLIEDYSCLPSFHMPFCTQQLKIGQTDKFLRRIAEEVNVHYGFGIDEYRRIQKVMARLLSKGYNTEFLAYKSGISNEQIKTIIKEEWKIELPQPYKYLQHNNCIPCFQRWKVTF
ncbi:MAG TPA: hypothetical protein DCM73_12460 [Clostridiales bacterium]|nr:hypothetical protein [Clostridiales bacterium]